MTTTGHLINMDSELDRWNKCVNEFENLNVIKLQRFSAIKHENGHVGCFLSHLEILKNNSQNDTHILVLEDDVNIIDKYNFNERWLQIKQWLDNNDDKWDIFNGGPYQINDNRLLSKTKSGTFKILNNELNIVQVGPTMAAHFVYYNKHLYEKIKNIDYNKICIDRLTDAISTLKIVTTYPYLAYQYPGNSGIEKKFVNFADKMKRTENQLRDRLNKEKSI